MDTYGSLNWNGAMPLGLIANCLLLEPANYIVVDSLDAGPAIVGAQVFSLILGLNPPHMRVRVVGAITNEFITYQNTFVQYPLALGLTNGADPHLAMLQANYERAVARSTWAHLEHNAKVKRVPAPTNSKFEYFLWLDSARIAEGGNPSISFDLFKYALGALVSDKKLYDHVKSAFPSSELFFDDLISEFGGAPFPLKVWIVILPFAHADPRIQRISILRRGPADPAGAMLEVKVL